MMKKQLLLTFTLNDKMDEDLEDLERWRLYYLC